MCGEQETGSSENLLFEARQSWYPGETPRSTIQGQHVAQPKAFVSL